MSSHIILFLLGLVIGFLLGYIAKAKEWPLKTKDAIALLVAFVWACSAITAMLLPESSVDPLISGALGGIILHLFPIVGRKQ